MYALPSRPGGGGRKKKIRIEEIEFLGTDSFAQRTLPMFWYVVLMCYGALFAEKAHGYMYFCVFSVFKTR